MACDAHGKERRNKVRIERERLELNKRETIKNSKKTKGDQIVVMVAWPMQMH